MCFSFYSRSKRYYAWFLLLQSYSHTQMSDPLGTYELMLVYPCQPVIALLQLCLELRQMRIELGVDDVIMRLVGVHAPVSLLGRAYLLHRNPIAWLHFDIGKDDLLVHIVDFLCHVFPFSLLHALDVAAFGPLAHLLLIVSFFKHLHLLFHLVLADGGEFKVFQDFLLLLLFDHQFEFSLFEELLMGSTVDLVFEKPCFDLFFVFLQVLQMRVLHVVVVQVELSLAPELLLEGHVLLVAFVVRDEHGVEEVHGAQVLGPGLNGAVAARIIHARFQVLHVQLAHALRHRVPLRALVIVVGLLHILLDSSSLLGLYLKYPASLWFFSQSMGDLD